MFFSSLNDADPLSDSPTHALCRPPTTSCPPASLKNRGRRRRRERCHAFARRFASDRWRPPTSQPSRSPFRTHDKGCFSWTPRITSFRGYQVRHPLVRVSSPISRIHHSSGSSLSSGGADWPVSGQNRGAGRPSRPAARSNALPGREAASFALCVHVFIDSNMTKPNQKNRTPKFSLTSRRKPEH